MFMDRLIELLENKIQEIQNPEVFKETEEIETEYNLEQVMNEADYC